MEIPFIDLYVPTWLVLLVATAVLYVYYMSRNFSMYRKMGIPGPKPIPVLGNMLDIQKHGMHGADIMWREKYGKVYGSFDSLSGNLVVADPEMLKEIIVKQFNNFADRRTLDGLNGDMNKSVNNIKGEYWRFVRNIITPSFSTGKLRKMFRLVQKATDTMVKTLKEKLKTENVLEMRRVFAGYTFDVVTSTSFGIEVDSQGNPDDPFVKHGKNLIEITLATPKILVYGFLPFLRPIMRMMKISVFPTEPQIFFRKALTDVLEGRTQKREDYADLLQLMKDAQVENDDAGGNNGRGLTKEEIIAQAEIFVIAGFDTTSLLLSWTAYELALNPDIQQRLREDLEKQLQGRELDYDTVHELEYLDMIIHESLRKFPPVIRFDRVCTNDTEINGIKFKKGMIVAIPVYAIHHDPEVWENPEVFDPERFSKENRGKHGPYDFIPFGNGPRNCIGMRLALLEAKMAIIQLVRHFSISVCNKTQVPPKLMSMTGILKPMEVYLKVEELK